VKKIHFSFLDHENPDEVASYEKALFRAFYNKNSPIESLIWDADVKAKRLTSKIPYKNQDIIIARLADLIIGGVAVNYAMQEKLQLELLGFEIDKTEPDICEGRALFNTHIFDTSTLVALEMKEFMFNHLKKKNITKVYANCSEKRLRGYLILGWKEIGSKDFGALKAYLLQYTL